MTEEFFPFDPAEALDSKEARELFLAVALNTGDAVHIAAAREIVARAESTEKLAARPGGEARHHG